MFLIIFCYLSGTVRGSLQCKFNTKGVIIMVLLHKLENVTIPSKSICLKLSPSWSLLTINRWWLFETCFLQVIVVDFWLYLDLWLHSVRAYWQGCECIGTGTCYVSSGFNLFNHHHHHPLGGIILPPVRPPEAALVSGWRLCHASTPLWRDRRRSCSFIHCSRSQCGSSSGWDSTGEEDIPRNGILPHAK